jgi:hypothetical protein
LVNILETRCTKHKKYTGFSKFILCEYLLQKFRSVYSPEKELSPDEAVIPRAVIEILNIQSLENQFGMWVQNSMGMIM